MGLFWDEQIQCPIVYSVVFVGYTVTDRESSMDIQLSISVLVLISNRWCLLLATVNIQSEMPTIIKITKTGLTFLLIPPTCLHCCPGLCIVFSVVLAPYVSRAYGKYILDQRQLVCFRDVLRSNAFWEFSCPSIGWWWWWSAAAQENHKRAPIDSIEGVTRRRSMQDIVGG